MASTNTTFEGPVTLALRKKLTDYFQVLNNLILISQNRTFIGEKMFFEEKKFIYFIF